MGTWAQKWWINAGPKHVTLPDRQARFALKKRKSGGHTWYKLKYVKDEMDPAWKRCWFARRGNQRLTWNYNPLPVFKPDNTCKKAYKKAVDALLKSVDANTERLEGEIEVQGKTESVILFLARGAITGNKDLLMIVTRTFFADVSPRIPVQDGTGHADPH